MQLYSSFVLVCLFALLHQMSADAPKVVSAEELASKNGKDSEELWLSILGEVYDVTAGKTYYGEGAPYSIFVGRDGSVPFVTGKFTPDEASKSPLEELTARQLYSLNEWKAFYQKEGKYPFVGLLQGKYYDEAGQPTEELVQIRQKIEEAKIQVEADAKARQERIKQRKAAAQAAATTEL